MNSNNDKQTTQRYCWKCGKFAGVYELCPECQEKKNKEELNNDNNQKEESEKQEDQPQTTVNQSINIENESTPFKNGFETVFGGGCGCAVFILVITIIGIILLLTIAEGAI